MRVERLAAPLLLLTSAMLAAANASAFCRTTTDSRETADCTPSGRPLFWKSQCVGYHMNRAASRQIGFDDARILMARAFREWQGGASVCAPSITIVELSPTDDRTAGYDLNGANENIVAFQDEDWLYPEVTLEVVTLTYRPTTGEILDADIEINTRDATYLPVELGDAGGPTDGTEALDMGLMLAHAAGHFLGLSHSEDPTSIMLADTEPGPHPRPLLSADDGAAICAAYPEAGGRSTTDDQGLPVTIESTPCALAGPGGTCGPLDVTHGCSMSPPPASHQWLAAVGIGAALALFGRCRHDRRFRHIGHGRHRQRRCR